MSKPAKKTVQEKNDEILEIGKEGKEGVKNAAEHFKSEEKEIKEQEARIIEEIEKKRKTKEDYNLFLSRVLIAELESLEIPLGWYVNVAHNQEGVIMELKSPDNRIFRSAFASTGEPKVDYNAVHTYALRAEDTIYRMKQNGIIRV